MRVDCPLKQAIAVEEKQSSFGCTPRPESAFNDQQSLFINHQFPTMRLVLSNNVLA